MNLDTIKNVLTKRTDLQILNKNGIIEWLYNKHNFKNKKDEDEWGKTFSNKKQWTTFVGEKILEDILFLLNKNPKKIKPSNAKKSVNGKCLLPDFECDDSFYENKARTYNTSGTAGDKILMSAYKYSECYILSNKPVYIVCMAYQEVEADKVFMIFNPVIECHKRIIKSIESNNVFFVKATELLNRYIKSNASNIQNDIKYTPLLKWAGGKRQIIDKILPYFPKEFKNYHEPFIGSLSVFLEMKNNNFLFENKKIFLSDSMEPLMNLYNVVKNNKKELINELQSEKYINNLENYTNNKILFNSLKKKCNENCVKLAAIFIFLNKTGFNGMYRENSSGDFNIPFGKQNNPTICNQKIINELHSLFENNDIIFKMQDFSCLLENVSEGDFIYLDPPYHGTFSNYTKDKFDENQHKILKNIIDELHEKKCKFVLSNSDTEFIRDLYKKYTIIEIPVKRLINSKAENRKDIKYELLIFN